MVLSSELVLDLQATHHIRHFRFREATLIRESEWFANREQLETNRSSDCMCNKMAESPKKVQQAREGESDVSIMRNTVNTHVSGKDMSTRKHCIIKRREAFKWLPVWHDCNDLVTGSWLFVWGSALTALIPCFPLIGLFYEFWVNADILPLVEHVAAYGMLAFCGVFYTIGSWALVRAFDDPTPKPMFTWKHFASDELFAMWMFFIGTIPSVPIMAVYLAYNRDNGTFALALLICIVVSFLTWIVVLCCYPNPGHPGVSLSCMNSFLLANFFFLF